MLTFWYGTRAIWNEFNLLLMIFSLEICVCTHIHNLHASLLTGHSLADSQASDGLQITSVGVEQITNAPVKSELTCTLQLCVSIPNLLTILPIGSSPCMMYIPTVYTHLGNFLGKCRSIFYTWNIMEHMGYDYDKID